MSLRRRPRLMGVIVGCALAMLALTGFWLDRSHPAATQASSRLTAGPSPESPSSDAPLAPAVEGISDIADLPSSMGLFINVYARPEGDYNLGVWAGVAYSAAHEKDRSRGILVVGLEDRRRRGTSFETYPTPTKHGALRIESVSGDVLSVSAADGTRFSFDLRSRTYVPAPSPT